MCLAYRIKHVNSSPLGATSFFVPCGKCEECRAAIKNAWAFRLRAEIEHKLNLAHRCVFFTLTYSDERLPRLGWDCFTDEFMHDYHKALELKTPDYDVKVIAESQRLSRLPCFSRDDVEHFVKDIKNWLYRTYDLTDISFFGASEFGSNTKRPHYHFLMILPEFIDFRELFKQVHSHWVDKGHVFPRYFEGGIDSHGYHHKPFVVKSAVSAARYCAKYATKDLYYSEFLQNNGITNKIVNLDSRLFKRKMVFHIQKKSLGACILNNLTNEDKVRLYTIGHAFIGDDKLTPIPVYIKNKLVFDNDYVWEPHTLLNPSMRGCKELGVIALREDYTFKRLVRRKANDFFCNNSKEIYEHKVKTYEQFFMQFWDVSKFEKRKISSEFIRDAQDLMSWLSSHCSFSDLARYYLLYDGVPKKMWYYTCEGDEHLLYLARYLKNPNYEDFFPFSDCPDHAIYISVLLDVLDMVISCFYLNPLSKSEAERLQDRIADFFKSLQTN